MKPLGGTMRRIAFHSLAAVCWLLIISPPPAPPRATGSPNLGRSANPAQIASAAGSQPSSTALAAEYSDNLDAQLRGIASLVAKRLTTEKEVTPDRAEKAAVAFADSLKRVMKQALTRQQFKEIVASLGDDRFWLVAPNLDITDLEIQYHTLVWTDIVNLYLKRKPTTPDQKELLGRQVETLIAAFRSAMEKSLSESEMAQPYNPLEYLTHLLHRDFNGPVIPVMKRPFSQNEMSEMEARVSQAIPRTVASWRASPGPIATPPAITILPLCNDLWGRIWRTEYHAPSLSPELMRRMQAERRAMNQARAKRFDQLPDDEKKREYERMLRSEEAWSW